MADVKIELPRISRPDVYTLLAPILPGTILLGAVSYRNWFLASKFVHSSFPGYYVKVACLFLVAYALGYMMMFLANTASHIFASAVLPRLKSEVVSPENAPWHRPEWRKLARRFIGPELTPATNFPFDANRYKAAVAAAQNIVDPNQQTAALQSIFEARDALCGADNEWLNWYYILREYVVDSDASQQAQFAHQLVYLFYATSVAGLVSLLLVAEARNWFLWSVFSLGTAVGLLYPLAVQSLALKTPAWDNVMSAQMLRILRQRPSDSVKTQAQAAGK